MKKRSAVTAGDLVDPGKRGTIIIGSYRCGSHFVDKLCVQQCLIRNIPFKRHGELLYSSDDKGHTLGNLIKDLETDDRYHMIIINHLEHKLDLMRNAGIADWLLVRVVNHDKHRWYQSYFYHSNKRLHEVHQKLHGTPSRRNGRQALYFGDYNSGHYYDVESGEYVTSWQRNMGEYQDDELTGTVINSEETKNLMSPHHGQSSHLYEKFLDSADLNDADVSVYQLTWHMINHWVSNLLPVDKELDYKNLSDLSNDDVVWLPNYYPNHNVLSRFADGPIVDQLLSLWTDPSGRFKEDT